ncbi:MAG: hypothetical protein OEN50_06910 [Deltaproteobacteria bacterium]|nr:hypothetical protein [Deltaproteobacteria bacterium]
MKKLSKIFAFGAGLMFLQATQAIASDVVLLHCDGFLAVHDVKFSGANPGIAAGDDCASSAAILLGAGFELKSTTELGVKEAQVTPKGVKIKNPNHPSLPAVLMTFVLPTAP